MKSATLATLGSVVLAALTALLPLKTQAQVSPFFFSIVDNNYNILPASTGAGFYGGNCSGLQSGDVIVLNCQIPPEGNYYPFTGLVASLALESRECAGVNEVPTTGPYLFAEYPTPSPDCFSWSFDADLEGNYTSPPGSPNCLPGGQTPSGYTGGCQIPYIFTATPTATTSGGATLVPSEWQISYLFASGSVQGSCIEPPGELTCTNYPPANGEQIVGLPNITLIYAPPVKCAGFQSPFTGPIALHGNSNRAIPLKVQLFDSNGNLVTPSSAILNGAMPIVNVVYSSNTTPGEDLDYDLLPEGDSSTGNQLTYESTSETWQFNLSTAPYVASGTYTVSIGSGHPLQYAIPPTCSQTFSR